MTNDGTPIPYAAVHGILEVGLACLLILGLASQGIAGYDEGVAAFDRGDYTSALQEFFPLAKAGFPPAQHTLGVMYEEGRGVWRDYGEALRWYRLAAAQGFADAQVNLGVMYSRGQGVPQDHAEALRWYNLAAAQGNAWAMNNLGVMYERGTGVPQDLVHAFAWYQLAVAHTSQGPPRGIAIRNRDRVARELSPEQRNRAHRIVQDLETRLIQTREASRK